MLIMSNPSSSSSAQARVQVQSQSQSQVQAAAQLASQTSSAAPRNLLISIADHIHRSSDLPSARRLISCLLASSSPLSDSVDDRIAHQFLLALALRISISSININPSTSSSSSVMVVDHEQISQSSYLSLNQITPFLRFCHLTANQAILDSLTATTTTCLHILDFDTLHGLQWPPLLQALADRNANISVRITGTGSDLSLLRRTAARLHSFAASLNLPFHFHPLLLTTNNISPSSYDSSSLVQLYPNETLAVNCVMFLSKLMRDGNLFDPEGSREVRSLLRAVRAMNPAIVTVAEKEANFSSPHFFTRFMEALDYYTAVFESLEGTLPAGNRERMEVEQVWFGKEIADVVAGDQHHIDHHHQLMRRERRERSLRFEKWEEILRGEGLRSRALSPFAVSQARLLLRLHYPSEGYQLKIRDDHALFLGWQDKPLFSVSSWH